jgi:hypothetical protein
MKLKNLMVEDSNIEVNEKIKKIKYDSEKYNRRFFRNEVAYAIIQIKQGIKK